MKYRLFIDTSAFFAIMIKSDRNHKIAMEIFKKIPAYYNSITSEPVLSETLTLLKRKFGIHIAGEFGDIIIQSPNLDILYVDAYIFNKGMEILKKYWDQDFSFTDCLSFALLKKENIDKVFGFDKHFSYMGFDTNL